MNKSIVIFYHADCVDGVTAGWAAWKKFGTRARYIPAFYDDLTPLEIKDSEVYTVDMVFPDSVTDTLMKQNTRVTAIDHHISRKETVLATHQPLYDNNHSGAVLAWQYFHPGKPVPVFFKYVEDVDLWRLKFAGGEALYNYLRLFPFEFKIWSRIIVDFEKPDRRKKILDTGRMLARYSQNIITHHIQRNARLVEFAGHIVYAINDTEYTSQIGHRLYVMRPPFAIIWKQSKDGQVHVSIRGDGTINVSEIAKQYGGGGHRDAAGFSVPSLNDIPWK